MHIQAALLQLLAHPELFPLLTYFKQQEYEFAPFKRMEEVPWDLLRLINTHGYLPSAICVHVGKDDLHMLPKYLVRQHVRELVAQLVGMVAKAAPSKRDFVGILISLPLQQRHFKHFNNYKLARKARRNLAQHLGSQTSLAECIVVPHDFIDSHEQWYRSESDEDEHLSPIGYRVFLHDFSVQIAARAHPEVAELHQTPQGISWVDSNRERLHVTLTQGKRKVRHVH